MKLIFDNKFRFYTSKMNEICLHCHWLCFSSIILSFGQCVWCTVRSFCCMFCMIYVKHQARDKNKLLKLFSIFDLQYIKYDWKYVYRDGKKSLQNCILEAAHSVLEHIWVKGSNLSKWLPQGERGPPKESKSRWIEILHIGSQFT